MNALLCSSFLGVCFFVFCFCYLSAKIEEAEKVALSLFCPVGVEG